MGFERLIHDVLTEQYMSQQLVTAEISETIKKAVEKLNKEYKQNLYLLY